MKFKWFLVTWIFWLALASGKQQSFVVPSAINAIIDEHFATLKSQIPGFVSIVWFGDETKELKALMTKLTEVKNLNIKIKILKDNLDEKSEEEQFQLPDPSIVFFDSVEKFKALARNISWNSNLHQHLVYVPGLTISDIIETLSDGFLIDEVNFLMNETLNSIDLVTSFMFTEQACRVQQLKTINRFNSNTSKWDGSIFYPKKYQNFHDCELTISKVEGIHSGVFHLMELIFETGLNASLTKHIKNVLIVMIVI